MNFYKLFLFLFLFINCEVVLPDSQSSKGECSPNINIDGDIGHIKINCSDSDISRIYAEYIKRGKKAFNNDFNSNLAKHYFAKAVFISEDKYDERYARSLYYKIPPVARSYKIDLENMRKYKAYHLSLDGSEFVFCSKDEILIWNLKERKKTSNFENKYGCSGISLNDDKKIIITWFKNKIRMFDRKERVLLKTFNFESEDVIRISIDKYSNFLSASGRKDTVLYHIGSGEKVEVKKMLKPFFSSKGLSEKFYIKNIDFVNSKLLIKFREKKNIHAYQYTQTILYDLENNKVSNFWLNNKVASISRGGKYVAIQSEGYTGKTSSFKVNDLKDSETLFSLGRSPSRLNPYYGKKGYENMLYIRYIYYPNDGLDYVSINEIYDINNISKKPLFFFYLDGGRIGSGEKKYDFLRFSGNFLYRVNVINSRVFYYKYTFKVDRDIEKKDIIVKTILGTGKKLTSSGDLVELSSDDLKEIQREHFLKH